MNRTITSKATSFTDVSFEVHQDRPGLRAETFFFTQALEFVPHHQRRRHASGSARQRRFVRKVRTSHCSFSLTNGLSPPRGRLLRTQTLLPEGKREIGSQRYVAGFSRRPFHIFRRWRCASRYSKGALLQPQSCCCASLEHSGSKPFRSRSSRVETHYTISREQLERDVDEYLSKLENIGLVQRTGLFHESKAASAR